MIQASIVSFLSTNSPSKLDEIYWFMTCIKTHKISKRKLRERIADMVTEGHPIVSGHRGYSLVTTNDDSMIMEDLDKAIGYLSSYIMKLWARRKALKKTRERMTARLIHT